MRIKELSLETGASIRSLRYYETKHLIHSHRLENGYRDYDKLVVEKVKAIQLYLSLGLTTADIVQIMDCPTLTSNRPLCREAYELYKTKLEAVNKQISLLQNVQLRLEERINEFEKQ